MSVERDRKIVNTPFPISAGAWRTASAEYLAQGQRQTSMMESAQKEANLLARYNPSIFALIFRLDKDISDLLNVDQSFYRLGLLIGFRAHRSEAALRRGILPEIDMDTLVNFMAFDLGYSQNPSIGEQLSMRVKQGEVFSKFVQLEPQVWHDLSKSRFTSRETREGMHYGVADVNALFRKHAGKY